MRLIGSAGFPQWVCTPFLPPPLQISIALDQGLEESAAGPKQMRIDHRV